MKANYRKHNDGSKSKITYHKKDRTNTRSILKNYLVAEIKKLNHRLRISL